MGTLVVWTLLDLLRNQKATAVGAATAIVVGLVAITPAAGFVSPISALALGALAAFPSYYALLWRARTRLDDSLDVVAAHGVGGTVGALLTGVFAEKSWNGVADGLLFGNPAQLGIQAVAVGAAILYSGIVSFVLFKLVGVIVPLRAESGDEGLGMDVSQHGEEAYVDGEGAILVLPDRRAAGRAAGDGAGWRPLMKLIVAIVRPERLSAVLEGLFKAQVSGADNQPRPGTRRRARAGRDLSRHDREDGALRQGAARDRRLEPLRRHDGEGDPRAPPAPERSATARSSCCRSRRSSGSGPARKMRQPSPRLPLSASDRSSQEAPQMVRDAICGVLHPHLNRCS